MLVNNGGGGIFSFLPIAQVRGAAGWFAVTDAAAKAGTCHVHALLAKKICELMAAMLVAVPAGAA